MVVMTHKAFWDPVIAGMIFDRPLRFMAKKELFVNSAAAKFITSLGAFPIDRGAGDRAALTRGAGDARARERCCSCSPRATGSGTTACGEFLPGVGMIALRSGAPVMPLALDGTQDMLRDGKLGLPALRGLVGPPVDLGDITARNSKAYQEAARRMHDGRGGALCPALRTSRRSPGRRSRVLRRGAGAQPRAAARARRRRRRSSSPATPATATAWSAPCASPGEALEGAPAPVATLGPDHPQPEVVGSLKDRGVDVVDEVDDATAARSSCARTASSPDVIGRRARPRPQRGRRHLPVRLGRPAQGGSAARGRATRS